MKRRFDADSRLFILLKVVLLLLSETYNEIAIVSALAERMQLYRKSHEVSAESQSLAASFFASKTMLLTDLQNSTSSCLTGSFAMSHAWKLTVGFNVPMILSNR